MGNKPSGIVEAAILDDLPRVTACIQADLLCIGDRLDGSTALHMAAYYGRFRKFEVFIISF